MKNYLHQRSKSLLAFAVGLTILSSSFAGEAEAAKCYYFGWDMADDDTTEWSDENNTATLTGNKTVGFAYSFSKNFGSQSYNRDQGQCASLVTLNPDFSYNVAGKAGTENLTLGGDIIATQNNKLTVDKLDTLTITNGTCGLFANYGYKTGSNETGSCGGLYLSNIKNVDISGTLSAIYSDIKGNVTLSNIGTLNLKSDFTHASEDYGPNLKATEDNTITCDYGSIVNINAQNTTISSTGRAILATAHNVDKINENEDGNWETDTPWPQVNINSETLTIKAATSGPTAAAVYSDTGAIINLGSADNKIKILKFDQYQDEQDKKIYANMNLYSSSYIYEEKNTSRDNRYSDTIADGKTSDDYCINRKSMSMLNMPNSMPTRTPSTPAITH